MRKIRRIAVAAAVHGDEKVPALLLKKFERNSEVLQRPSFEQVFTLFANTRAFQENKRFIDCDLNRCFGFENLDTPKVNLLYEQQLAKQIYSRFQTWDIDLTIDCHSTSSAMGITLILNSRHPYLLRLSALVSTLEPSIKILIFESESEKNRLRELTELGLTVEIGCIPHNTFDSAWLKKLESLIHLLLDSIHKLNIGKSFSLPEQITCYEYVGSIDYPRAQNQEIIAVIHPQVANFQQLERGDALFVNLDTLTNIEYRGKKTVFPIFINESAYMKSVAALLTEKVKIVL
ncbi:MAG: aspartoacylase [Xenococcaceae cyanobacterium]